MHEVVNACGVAPFGLRSETVLDYYKYIYGIGYFCPPKK